MNLNILGFEKIKTVVSEKSIELMFGKIKGHYLEYVYQLFYMKQKQIHFFLKKINGFLNMNQA